MKAAFVSCSTHRLALLAIASIAAEEVACGQRPTMTMVTVHPTTAEYEQVLDFDVQADPDRVYVTASKGLAPTVFNEALKANPNATVDGQRVMPLMVLEPRGANEFAAQGSNTVQATLFANWQYIDRLVAWGGTSARNVQAPSQAWIDAAHRNGVKIYGNIFLAPTVYGGNLNQLDYLTQTDGAGAYPVADKLIEIAETQGFDGWFLNQETEGGDAALAEEVGKLVDYVQANSEVEVVWYDAMNESGGVGWQGYLNSNNDRFFQSNGEVVSDAMFLDFRNTSSGNLSSSSTLAQSLGRNPYDLYKGANLESSGITEGDGALDLVFSSENHTSAAMFRPDNESFDAFRDSGWDLQNQIRAEEQLYVGQAGDPSDTSQNVVAWDEGADAYSEATTWNGFADHIAAKSPLVRDRFVTNFNYGVGNDYYVEGEVANPRDWYNMGAQDVLPTWRWMVQTDDATPVDVNFDFTDAFIGGSSVRIAGSLDAVTDIPLYLASMDVHNDSKLTLTYKTGAVGASNLQVYIELEGDEGARIPIDVGPTTTDGWNEVELDLSAHEGQKIAGIGVRLLDADDADFAVSLGQLGVIRAERDLVAPPTDLGFQSIAVAGDTAEARLLWRHSTDYSSDFDENNVYYYNVSRRLQDDSRAFLGVTGGEGLYVDQIERDGGELRSTILVEALSLEFGVSEAATIEIFWAADLNFDGVLDQSDVDRFALNWRAVTDGLTYEEQFTQGDVNNDGVVDFDDWIWVRSSFQSEGVAYRAPSLVVPEPSAALLAIGALLGARVRPNRGI